MSIFRLSVHGKFKKTQMDFKNSFQLIIDHHNRVSKKSLYVELIVF